ncbi:unnamed protein product [Heterobilharzia americana]|nr:unnamed protein product [Heterobilharzia americana]
MESSEKQTPRSGNASKDRSTEGRTTSHTKRSVGRNECLKVDGRISVSSRRKNHPVVNRSKVYTKLIQTKSQSKLLNGRVASRLSRPKSRRGSKAVYVTTRPYRLRTLNRNSQLNNYGDEISRNNFDFPITTGKNSTEPIHSTTHSHKRENLKRQYRRPTLSSRKANSRTKKSHGNELATDFNTARKRHEAFVRDFAIATHLYRYLSQRHRDRPLYLNRNLSYLKSSTPRKQLSVPRLTLNKLLDRFVERQKNCKQNDMKASDKCCSSITECEWPQELELAFEGFYDSEKELDWVTVDASVNVRLRFGWAWRRKICPDDTLLNITSNSIKMNCYNHSTGVSSLINSGSLPTSNSIEKEDKRKLQTDSNSTCRFSLTNLIDQAKWNTPGGRITAAQLELRVSAVEKRWLKRPNLSCLSGLNGINQNILNGSLNHVANPTNHNGIPQSLSQGNIDVKNASQTRIICNPSRKGGLSSASYPVHYVTAPLPLIVPSIDFGSGSSSTSQQLLLTPGVYELRLGVDTEDDPVMSKSAPLKCFTAIMDAKSDISTTEEADGGCAGRIEWRRIRFPKVSKALDEYSRWPRLRFSVIWHHKSEIDQITSPYRPMETRRQDNAHTYTEGQSTHTTFTTNSHNRDVTKCQNQLFTSHDPTISKETCNSIYLNPTILDKSLSDRVQQSLSVSFMSESNKLISKKLFWVHPVTYSFIYGGNIEQFSESTDLICPWCHLDCSRAGDKGHEALLLHLRSCHPRFRFRATWNSTRSHLGVLVSLNEAYDGSNDCGLRKCGSGVRNSRVLQWHTIPSGQIVNDQTSLGSGSNGKHSDGQDSHSPSSSIIEATVRIRCPVRRLPYTHLIFWRGAERSAHELFDPTLSVRPMVVGHNRVYYHTSTTQPIRACEFDTDSEAEDAPVWLRQHYQRKIEEFTDVNQGEKQTMQLWNALLLSIHPSGLVVSDSQVLTILCQFIHQHSRWIHRRRLRINLLLHLTNLLDYGLISFGHLRQLMMIYDKRVQESNTNIICGVNTQSSTLSDIKLGDSSRLLSIPLPPQAFSISSGS